MKVCLVNPPMTQINTPYPGIAYLGSFLEKKAHSVQLIDLGLDLFLELFSREGLALIRDEMPKGRVAQASLSFFAEAFSDYQNTIGPVIRFLQGKDPSLALQIANRKFVPEGPRFLPLAEHGENLLDQFGSMGVQDKAKYIASLYLDDLADVVKFGVDSDFEFSRYAEKLASSQTSFNPLYEKLHRPENLIDRVSWKIFSRYLDKFQPELIGLSIPFPGNVYSGLRLAAAAKKAYHQIPIVMGGGFVNTELRQISDPRIFEFVDYLTYDDGERPIELLIEMLNGRAGKDKLLRTKYLEGGKIITSPSSNIKDVPFKEVPEPLYQQFRLSEYVSMLEMPNPMHRMWSDYRWNKMILAHGCYWKKCRFCDISLDYIQRFEPARAETIVDHFEAIMKQTGTSGFHFVDEAAPPALLKSMSKEILRRGLKLTWWGNLRFDTQFDDELVELMADAGCVAVTGGLEVASPRILELINKGIDIEQVARVTKSFSKFGIYVHAYLMYGFPTQTVQETVDSLEVVRQLFASGCLQSGHWHRFMATDHSPVGKNPQLYKIKLLLQPTPAEGLFARYELPFEEEVFVDHDMLGRGLHRALYNYMHGIGIEKKIQVWFENSIPQTSIKSDLIKKSITLHHKKRKT